MSGPPKLKSPKVMSLEGMYNEAVACYLGNQSLLKHGDQLPNGWRFSVPYKIFHDQTGFCWEGIGVPSDIREVNTKEDVQGGERMVLLNEALARINIHHLAQVPAYTLSGEESLARMIIDAMENGLARQAPPPNTLYRVTMLLRRARRTPTNCC